MPDAQVTEIYTDGACSGNPGPGGWGTHIEYSDGQVHELGGRNIATTNNRMEMQAAIAALDYLNQEATSTGNSQSVILHTDSEYLKNGITKWIKGWKRKGWKNSKGKPVLNKDLWEQLDELSAALNDEKLTVDWRYVRGHTGNPGNERCDEIARAYSHDQPISLSQYSAKANSSKQSSKRRRSSDADENASQPDLPLTATNTAKSNASQTIDTETTYKSVKLSTNAPVVTTGTPDEPSATPALRFDETALIESASDMASKNETGPDTGRIERLQNALKTLQVTDELAKQGYLITSAELADLMDVNASAVTSRGDYWAWRNWTVSRIRREGNQILWQLERIET